MQTHKQTQNDKTPPAKKSQDYWKSFPPVDDFNWDDFAADVMKLM